MQLDTRHEMRRLQGFLEFRSWRAFLVVLGCLAVALTVWALAGSADDLNPAARRMLFILVFAACLWTTEAIPAFSTGILVIALEIALLGRPGGVFAETPREWEQFVVILGHPMIWLFFGGFVLAAGASKTGLDRWLAHLVLRFCGRRPAGVLFGVMAITFAFSMFMSNTATAAMMIAVLAPLTAGLAPTNRFGKGMLLAVPVGANLGGMGSIIGSPPNAIAVGALDALPGPGVTFLDWMLLGLPPALALAALAWGFILWRYPSDAPTLELDATPMEVKESPEKSRPEEGAVAPLWQRLLVMTVFVTTILLWITGEWHGLPTTVVSFLPITAFTSTGLLRAKRVRNLPWDILLLIAGGLALGLGVMETGLADWLVSVVPAGELGVTGLVLLMTYGCLALSNFMSNTAAANVLIPISIAMMTGFEARIAVPIALGASAAMCLPISTPPNAIAFGTGRIETRDFMVVGLIIGVVAPIAAVAWTSLVIPRLLG